MSRWLRHAGIVVEKLRYDNCVHGLRHHRRWGREAWHTIRCYSVQIKIKKISPLPFHFTFIPTSQPTATDCFPVFLSSALSTARHMASVATAEACDSNAALLTSGDLRALQPMFKIYGQSQAFSGPIVTLKVFEDNVIVRELLETRGDGRVLVIDGGGSLRCALVGGNLAQLAQNMGWAGIVVNGCVRDVDEINGCDIGVRALNSNPLKSNKKGVGEKHAPVHIGGTIIRDGEWLYADSDGILISKAELSI